MRHVIVLMFAVLGFVGIAQGEQPLSSYQATDTVISTSGDKVAGHIGACVLGQGNKPRICFGLTKELEGEPRFTFLVLFRTGKKNCNPTGVSGQVNSDGKVTKTHNTFSLGEFNLPLTMESRGTESKLTVGDVELSGEEGRVVIVDLTGDKPVYKRVKVKLPACKVNLADRDRTSWPKAIDEAIAELKKQSKEVKELAD